eukprot:gnl/Spiro4/8809_TR4632_c0_g4_i1.p3 gnl/Spiro4/8809_TR4632_c0_g4~~gnl/Spiro4/8809_TR4632_c0_g4_i1.p3  ORF type:complete len:102 (-),score=12.18 gnl/Spiro4/8809_TR4632_c0_g4_i1:70-375(-)
MRACVRASALEILLCGFLRFVRSVAARGAPPGGDSTPGESHPFELDMPARHDTRHKSGGNCGDEDREDDDGVSVLLQSCRRHQNENSRKGTKEGCNTQEWC